MTSPCTSFPSDKKESPNSVLYGFLDFEHLFRWMEPAAKIY